MMGASEWTSGAPWIARLHELWSSLTLLKIVLAECDDQLRRPHPSITLPPAHHARADEWLRAYA